jgi:murein DD-endopeptidase MepM/ murein hydrolase activator NlpD
MVGLLPAAATLAVLLAVGVGVLGPGQGPAGGPAAVVEHPPRPAAAPPPGRVGSWRWPLDPAPRVVRGFHPGPAPWSPGHRGVDLAATGREVLAAHAGVVSFAGILGGRGVVSIDHGGGLRTTYEPLVVAVRRGQRVSAGDPVGRLTDSGSHCAPAACLHWGAIGPAGYLDPLTLLAPAGPVVLLPMAPVR